MVLSCSSFCEHAAAAATSQRANTKISGLPALRIRRRMGFTRRLCTYTLGQNGRLNYTRVCVYVLEGVQERQNGVKTIRTKQYVYALVCIWAFVEVDICDAVFTRSENFTEKYIPSSSRISRRCKALPSHARRNFGRGF